MEVLVTFVRSPTRVLTLIDISGNMDIPGYPILRDTHISVTPGVATNLPSHRLLGQLIFRTKRCSYI